MGKAIFLETPMISNTANRLPKEILGKVDAARIPGVIDSYMLLSTDYEQQLNDPDVYPGLMSDEELK